jgi:O-antigen/teichoic acid export membrane protein
VTIVSDSERGEKSAPQRLSLKSNVAYSLLVNAVNAVFPLAVAPYVSRALGAESLGRVTFALSTVVWLVSLASFGTRNYGIREVAKARSSHPELSRLFSSLILIKFALSIVTLALYLVALSVVPKFRADYMIFLIAGANILFYIFEIDWFFQGLEQYRYIALRNVVVKTASLVAILLLVHNPGDYLWYGAVSVVALGANNIYNFFHALGIVSLQRPELAELSRHFSSLKVFFASYVVGTVFYQFDRVLLGLLDTTSAVAFYARALSLVTFAQVAMNSVSIAIIPRISYYFQSDRTKYLALAQKSAEGMLLLGLPITVGMMMLSREIMLLFGGPEFEQAYAVLLVVAALIVIGSVRLWNYNQVMIPLQLERTYLYTQVMMSAVFLVGCFTLVPRIGYIGAGISLVVTHTLGLVTGDLVARNHGVRVRFLSPAIRQVIAATIIMAALLAALKVGIAHVYIRCLTAAIVAPLCYVLSLTAMKSPLMIEMIQFGRGMFPSSRSD